MRLKYPKLTTSKSLFELPGFQHKSLHGVEGSVLDCRPSDPGSNPSQCISLFLSFFRSFSSILLVKATAWTCVRFTISNKNKTRRSNSFTLKKRRSKLRWVNLDDFFSSSGFWCQSIEHVETRKMLKEFLKSEQNWQSYMHLKFRKLKVGSHYIWNINKNMLTKNFIKINIFIFQTISWIQNWNQIKDILSNKEVIRIWILRRPRFFTRSAIPCLFFKISQFWFQIWNLCMF